MAGGPSRLGPIVERRGGVSDGRRRRRPWAWLARLVLLGVVFWIGLAVGRALEQAPRPGGTQTLVRTLQPGTLAPPTRTVTVTTATP